MGASLKEVRERIRSVQSTQQITKAMKMVSAAKLRKAQTDIVQFRPYANKLNKMLSNILSNLGDGEANVSFGQERTPNKVLLVVITSNRGLCGSFNSDIIKKTISRLNTDYAAQRKAGQVSMLFIGKKGLDFFRRRYQECTKLTDHVELLTYPSYDKISEVSKMIMDGFQQGTWDRVEVVYSRFKNAASVFAEAAQFLPVPKTAPEEGQAQKKADYIFEPDMQSMLEYLIPTILQSTFYRYCLDNNASEHGSRMTAMDKATENAEELVKELKINYNKARQEAITRELSEIVGGAAALQG